MATTGKKISDLTERTALNGREEIPFQEAEGNGKFKVDNLKKYVQPDLSDYQKSADADKKYVAKEAGKRLMTDAEAGKLEGLSNYNDTEVKKQISDEVTRAKAAEAALGGSVTTLRNDIDLLMYQQADYYVEEYVDAQLDPEPISSKGAKEWLDDWRFYLMDTTLNTGKTSKPAGELKRNNLLRFADGSFAPAVGIKQAMYDECMTNALYVKSGETYTEKYASGAYDAAAQWEEDKALIQAGTPLAALYKADGSGTGYVEISHRLRPWETVETKYTVVKGRADTIYPLDGVTGKSGKVWRGIFSKPTVWDGFDTTPFALAPTGIFPCPATTVGGKMRSFFYLYAGEANCVSSAGNGGLIDIFSNGRTYPRVNDVQQVSNMTMARANNADPDLPYPFAEGGFHARNACILTTELLHSTKNINDPNLFGSGISSVQGCNNESEFRKHGGVRYRKKGDTSWSYQQWSGTPNIYKADGTKHTYWSSLANNEFPKEQCMESQLAYSYAQELGVAENTDFDFYGGLYNYVNVGDTPDRMNARVYKVMAAEFDAYNADKTAQTFETEFCLRMSLFDGVNLAGDIFAYCGGGYEQVFTIDHTKEESNKGYPVSLYLQPDQELWEKEPAITKPDYGKFGFEETYIRLADTVNLGDGFARKRQPYSAWKIQAGGGHYEGECYYAYDRNENWGSVIGTRGRAACRSRGYAPTWYYASARDLIAVYVASAANRYLAGSAQVLLDVGAQPLRSSGAAATESDAIAP